VLEWCDLSQQFTDDIIDKWGVGCSVSYKRIMDILNRNLSNMDVCTVALLFHYKRLRV